MEIILDIAQLVILLVLLHRSGKEEEERKVDPPPVQLSPTCHKPGRERLRAYLAAKKERE